MFMGTQSMKMSFVTSTTKEKEQNYLGTELLYATYAKLISFKWDCLNFRILYVIPMVTTEKISVGYTQEEMRRNQNMPLQWNQQNTNTGSNSKKWGSKKLEDIRKQK